MHSLFRSSAVALLCALMSVAPAALAANTWDYPVLDAKDGWVAASWEAAGTVALVDGDAMITALSGEQRKAVSGDTLRQGETISTADDAEVQVDMEDGGLLSLRPQTRVTVQSYKAEGSDDDRSIMWLDRGTIRTVTGWIGHNSRSRLQVAILTPNATVGVRGTDHETTYLPPGDARGEPGTYDKVNEGSTVIRNTVRGGTGASAAEVVVRPGLAGFHAAGSATGVAARPRVLAAVPTFYRPARNDAAFEQRRDALRSRLDTLARERQARTDTRRAALGLAPLGSARPVGAGRAAIGSRADVRSNAVARGATVQPGPSRSETASTGAARNAADVVSGRANRPAGLGGLGQREFNAANRGLGAAAASGGGLRSVSPGSSPARERVVPREAGSPGVRNERRGPALSGGGRSAAAPGHAAKGQR
jgi:hypothetical protein